MLRRTRCHLLAIVLTCGLACTAAWADETLSASTETVQWFQKTEQALMEGSD